jgi:hypothetical protein
MEIPCAYGLLLAGVWQAPQWGVLSLQVFWTKDKALDTVDPTFVGVVHAGPETKFPWEGPLPRVMRVARFLLVFSPFLFEI